MIFLGSSVTFGAATRGVSFADYKVYNISIGSGKQLSDEELLSAAGFTQEEYLE